MAAHCDLDQMTQTVQRLQIPLVARMLALDIASSTPEGHEKIQRYIKIAQLNPPTDDRMDALDALDAAAGSSDLITDFTLAYLTGMMAGLGAPSEVVDQLRSRRNELKAQMQNNLAVSMSVTYHGVARAGSSAVRKRIICSPVKAILRAAKQNFCGDHSGTGTRDWPGLEATELEESCSNP